MFSKIKRFLTVFNTAWNILNTVPYLSLSHYSSCIRLEAWRVLVQCIRSPYTVPYSHCGMTQYVWMVYAWIKPKEESNLCWNDKKLFISLTHWYITIPYYYILATSSCVSLNVPPPQKKRTFHKTSSTLTFARRAWKANTFFPKQNTLA